MSKEGGWEASERRTVCVPCGGGKDGRCGDVAASAASMSGSWVCVSISSHDPANHHQEEISRDCTTIIPGYGLCTLRA